MAGVFTLDLQEIRAVEAGCLNGDSHLADPSIGHRNLCPNCLFGRRVNTQGSHQLNNPLITNTPLRRSPRMAEVNSERTAQFVQKKAGILPAFKNQIRLITYS